MKKKIINEIIAGLILLIAISNASAASQLSTSSTSDFSRSYQVIGGTYQYTDPGFSSRSDYVSPSVYWPNFGQENCKERQDFIVQVAPGGCEPAVVRSDLLEEQNVPVFCKLTLIQANPLIEVSRVKSISFSGSYPEGIAGVGYFPARYYTANRNDIASTPVDDNIGYFVVSLRQQQNEDKMPEWIEGNLTAVISYDVQNTLGIGKTNFYVSELSDQDWERDYQEYGIWKGNFYVRAEYIDSDSAKISLYRDKDTIISSFTLKKGATSDPIYLPGFYCQAGLKVNLEKIDAPVDSALIQVNDIQQWVSLNDKVINDLCRVTGISSYGESSQSGFVGGGKVSISCPISNGNFDLTLVPGKATFSFDGTQKSVSINENLKDDYYLGYIGSWNEVDANTKEKKKINFAVVVKDSWAGNSLGFQEKEVYSTIDKIISRATSTTKFEDLSNSIKTAVYNQYSSKIGSKQLQDKNINKDNLVFIIAEGKALETPRDEKDFADPAIKLDDVNFIKNSEYADTDSAYSYYKRAIESYKNLAQLYPNEKSLTDSEYFEPYATYGLASGIDLAGQFNMLADQQELLADLRASYPDSKLISDAEKKAANLVKYDSKEAKAVVNLRDGSYFVQLLDFKKPTKDELSANLMINGEGEVLGVNDINYSNKGTQQAGFIEGNVKSAFTLKQLYDLNLPSSTTFTIDNKVVYLNGVELAGGIYNFYGISKTDTLFKGEGSTTLGSFKISNIKIPVGDITTNKYSGLFASTPSVSASSTALGTAAGESIQVTKIDQDLVQLQYNKQSEKGAASESKQVTLTLDKPQTIVGSFNMKLLKTNVKKQVKLNLDSVVNGPVSYANFSFKVGIEKRGIQLSPNKTQEMIDNLQENIAKWQSINDKLGKVVEGMKGACFATSAVLIAKNLVTGFSGEAMARNNVMTGSQGWNDYCNNLASTGDKSKYNQQVYSSPDKCLLDHNSYIENDVKIASQSYQATNTNLQNSQGEIQRTDILDIEGQVKDRTAMEAKYKASVSTECAAAVQKFKLYDDFCTTGSFENVKDVTTLYRTLNTDGLSDPAIASINAQANAIASEANAYNDEVIAREKANADSTTTSWGKRTEISGEKQTPAYIKTTTAETGQIAAGSDVIRVFIRRTFGTGVNEKKSGWKDGKDIIVKLDKDTTSGTYTYSSNSFYDVQGNPIPCSVPATGASTAPTTSGSSTTPQQTDCSYINDYLNSIGASSFIKSGASAYQNSILNPDKLQVKYFDRAPYKGLPAEVPFDVKDGWYVEMEYVVSGFGKPYDESGRVVNFYICNVGGNHLIEFKKKADDICRYYNGVSDELGFPGLDASKSRSLVMQAKNAISQAMTYYGKKEAIINGQRFTTGTSFGGSSGKCSDFMSPQDCNIMFNVCDPVICPSSRCDLGGNFKVDNVIQTGIIGSLVLCLPNFKEGIYIPVCLTGVHAGIENYVSILESERACLNESLTTGKNIGICDEITSIYMCEFFWRQMVPFFDVLVPKLIEGMFSQGTRGGGEYLTVQSSWDNTQKAVDYFKNEYAVNSMQAYQMRSTEEAGSEVCRSFISARYPTDIDILTEPDSPSQYTGWFDENIMTTATPYPTSHYKVYYHIFAGNDQGAYYSVYLKDISDQFASAYVYTSQRYVVKTGYLSKGETADQANDFTAPSGYKQMCISINGQEDCGFGKVSTSFAVNYVSDKFASEQASQNVTTSKACVSGTPSIYSLAQPNIQSGTEEVLSPELYNQGITRVCSTYNPGKQVDSNGLYDTTNSTFDRWQDVGYCDDPKLRCWLDAQSVKDVIQNKGIEQQTLSNVDTSIVSKGYLTVEKSIEIANKAKTDTANLNVDKNSGSNIDTAIIPIVSDLNKLSEAGPNNAYRARALLLLGDLYKKVALGLHGETNLPLPTNQQGVNQQQAPVSTDTNTNTVDLSKWEDSMLRNLVLITAKTDKGVEISFNHLESPVRWVAAPSDYQILFPSSLGYVDGVKKIAEIPGVESVVIGTDTIIIRANYDSNGAFTEAILEALAIKSSTGTTSGVSAGSAGNNIA